MRLGSLFSARECVSYRLLPRYFAAEIIGSMLDLEPRKWRKPRRVDPKRDKERIDKFVKSYAPYDWTGMLKEQK